MTILSLLKNYLFFALEKLLFFIYTFWWFFVFLFFLSYFWSVWLKYIKTRYNKSLNWITLEVLVFPSEETSLKSMEQVFAGFYSVFKKSISFWEKYFLGVFREWFRIDILAQKNEIRFFLTIPEKFRLLTEKRIYAQYPEAEIKAVEHPLSQTEFSPKEDEIWGTTFKFVKENSYPILTYQFLAKDKEKGGEGGIDPLDVILEAIANLSETSIIGLSYYLRPTGDEWQKEGQKIAKELAGFKEPRVVGPIEQFIDFLLGVLTGWFTASSGEVSRGERKEPNLSSLMPGQKKVIEAIENKISKPGFEVGIRIFYSDKKENFDKTNIANLSAIFSHFNSPNLNSLVPNKEESTSLVKFKWFLKKKREKERKIEFFSKVKNGLFPSSFVILNCEELATLCHFPTIKTKVPFVKTIKLKRGEPPANLPY